jgi:hypothetical protein
MLRRLGNLISKPVVRSPAEFSASIIAGYQATHPGVTVDIGDDDLTLIISCPGASPTIDTLHRIYDIYLAEPDRLHHLIQLRAEALADTLVLAADTFPLTADSLVPMVRPLAAIATETSVHQPLTAELHVCYAFDLPNAMVFATEERLAEAAVSRTAVHEIALSNYARYMNRIEIEAERDGVVLMTSSDLWASSFLLLPAVWTSRSFGAMSGVSAIAPDRNLVVAFDTARDNARAKAVAIATEELSLSPSPMSAEVIVLR